MWLSCGTSPSSQTTAKGWDISVKPDHCKGVGHLRQARPLQRGFRGTGLLPFSRKHVIDKITPPDTVVRRKEDAVGERDTFKVKFKEEAITSDEFIEVWKQLGQKSNRKKQRRARK